LIPNALLLTQKINTSVSKYDAINDAKCLKGWHKMMPSVCIFDAKGWHNMMQSVSIYDAKG